MTSSRKLKYTRPEERAETKSFYAYKGRVEEATRADFDVYKVVRTAGIRGTPRIPPEPIDTSSLTIDAAHIAAHGHGVTKEEAVEFIKKAV